jgi:membrane protein implicated in regulation of membrane protease activity
MSTVLTSKTTSRILGREPVLWLSLVAIGVRVISAFLVHVSTDQQATVMSLASTVAAMFLRRTQVAAPVPPSAPVSATVPVPRTATATATATATPLRAPAA